ncbi:MAG: tRNA (adenosine(37)-N6)-threonylcarbamoyltransferase complex transferase subunit TsaD [Candidatus Blackburnbacteria bacterium RIFCSPHIGHO2_02_FULL_39_13]|uniref:tRNA N6-adenosine threonylcarbamoyltransferase n=1 Tax=Candidatus Blackburnbacteria bacterium RIFCSPLOWO2_01_FULL_40_20 TaxID=1797519 RepID=A0A1G1VG66_9BACT|nr:MAG: putative tRNA threonylcarbamoyladenosine biosynthesis protein Gcp [Microgenomates group bacterium GW2011_GWA2_39_19]OGY07559.1 MAG: tRNA (adenosine(37)-N6)-threonylcarbamoyltransferase complex transferase subunit TsaD [Candidatus Blackburnbacteria bacterium RIFCSPHIGHO2_01_FULL_40_17]OGY08642.1 MAG: tRNA (adenosine(37)-N6)-threonylcarbamoyltransferase complex transferase subunit TsaD [Candidatus Blackburnbacteria bacterium RIFCSPHIGHO2_02_FULL_39_13]OGY14276.1 MAG: tRNA (adenosine(37)-N6
MLILGIETSCDETAASVVKDEREILSHVVASSAQMHIQTGGIIPERAAREQIKSIIPVIEEALGKGVGWSPKEKSVPPIGAIAVTAGGPGLVGSMLVGVETAKTLSFVWSKPIVPVVHLLGHVYANWLGTEPEPQFPLLFLTVSGGHTDLFYTEKHGDYKWIGGTRDDAAGEAFDKAARLLGLPYPGGPSIAAAAAKHEIRNSRPPKSGTGGQAKFETRLPRPMIGEDGFDFSFSGLKTAVSREVNNLKNKNRLDEEVINFLAFEVQEAISDVLVEKTLKAVEKYNVSTLLLAGGVSANQRLREKFQSRILDLDLNLDFRVPLPSLCTDNASFIAGYAFYNYTPRPWKEIRAIPNANEAMEYYGINKG